MTENKHQTRDPLPEDFPSIEAAAEFWETHSLADYWDETQEVSLDVRAVERQWVPLAAHLAGQAAERARQEGVSVETLVNLWVAERLQASAVAAG